MKNISNARIKRYAGIGSPGQAPENIWLCVLHLLLIFLDSLVIF